MHISCKKSSRSQSHLKITLEGNPLTDACGTRLFPLTYQWNFNCFAEASRFTPASESLLQKTKGSSSPSRKEEVPALPLPLPLLPPLLLLLLLLPGGTSSGGECEFCGYNSNRVSLRSRWWRLFCLPLSSVRPLSQNSRLNSWPDGISNTTVNKQRKMLQSTK